MRTHQLPYFPLKLTLAAIASLMLISCGREDDGFFGKPYHNFTAFFNPYYNAKIEYARGMKVLQSSGKLDRNAPLEIFPSLENAQGAKQSFDKVIEKCAIVLNAHPVSGLADNALLLMGKSYYYQKNFQPAERKFKEIITNYTDSDVLDEALFWYGRTLAQQGSEEARDVLGSVIASDKTSKNVKADAYFSLAELAIGEENYAEATKQIELGLPLTTDEDLKGRAAFTLARIYYRLADYASAEKAYALVLKLDLLYELRYTAQLSYAIVLREENRINDAIKEFNLLLNDDKNLDKFGEIRYELADCYRRQERLGKAIDLYIDVIRKYKKTESSAKSYYQLGKIKQEISSDFESARAFYDSSRVEFGQGEIKKISDEAFAKMDKILALYEAVNITDSTIQVGVVSASQIKQTVKIDTAAQLAEEQAGVKRQRTRRDYRKVVFYAFGGKEPFDATFGSSAEQRQQARARFTLPPAQDTATVIRYRKDLIDRMAAVGNFYHLTLPYSDSAITWYTNALTRTDDTLYTYIDSVKSQLKAIREPILYGLADVYRNLGNNEKVDSIYRTMLIIYSNSKYNARIREYFDLPPQQKVVQYDALLYSNAVSEMEKKNFTKAVTEFDSLIALYPQSQFRPKAILASAMSFQTMKQSDSALARYRTLGVLYPQSLEAKSAKITIDTIQAIDKKILDSLAALKPKLTLTDSLSKIAVKSDSLRTLNVKQLQLATIDSTKKMNLPDSTGEAALPKRIKKKK